MWRGGRAEVDGGEQLRGGMSNDGAARWGVRSTSGAARWGRGARAEQELRGGPRAGGGVVGRSSLGRRWGAARWGGGGEEDHGPAAAANPNAPVLLSVGSGH